MSEANAARGLSDYELRTLGCVLDLLIPPSADGRMPGAGEVGIDARIDQLAQRDPGVRATIAAGVAALEELAHARGAAEFAALTGEARLAALHEMMAAQHGFVPTLIFHTYAGYYQQGRVIEALGVGAHPPFPTGHQLEPFDETLLEPVLRRSKLYRDVPVQGGRSGGEAH